MRTLAPTPTQLAAIAAFALCACFDDPTPGTTSSGAVDTETSAGDGDGDAASGDGDGDSASGDGDGDAMSGDGDGDDSASGDGDGDDSASGDGDGDAPGVCGDGAVGDDEVCDEGPEPPLAEGACKPDCSGFIETRMLVKGQSLASGDFGGNPVATLDAECPVGYAAMFTDGVARRASTTPWATVDPLNWPVQPYTRYVNAEGEEVWITDEVALLGVRDGAHVDTTNPLGVAQNCVGMFCTNFRMVTGLKDDGTTLNADNCNGWSSAAPNISGAVGSFTSGELTTGLTTCDFNWMLIPTFEQPLCVELD